MSRAALGAEELEPHRRALWNAAYRITGVSADADEVVQETFMRALTAPPEDRSRELVPWLMRVAVNASRDVLRRRKRDGYVGPFLPSPIDTSDVPDRALSPGARYGELESVSYAFLLALEELSATQRSIVILRDVLDYSVRETAELLAMSEANVKTAHHRARAKLEAGYERERPRFDAEAMGVARSAMMRFFAHLALSDMQGLEALLSANAVGINDGGGEFFAAQRPVLGPARVARFFGKLGGMARVVRADPRVLNGVPAMIARIVPYAPRVAPVSANLFEIDREGRLARIYSVVASRKLTALVR